MLVTSFSQISDDISMIELHIPTGEMYIPVAILLFIATRFDPSNANVIANEVYYDDDKELVFALLVHRHGERLPDEDEFSFSDVQEKLKSYIYVHGYEGLTNEGKRTAYRIGKFLKQRYGSEGFNLVSSMYHKEQILVRSTDKERTKMTAQVAMSGLYPPGELQQWDDALGLLWQPVPYTSVPLSEDYLRYYGNCKKFIKLMAEAKKASIDAEFHPYKDLIASMFQLTGRNFTENPLLFETVYDLFQSQKALGLGTPGWAEDSLPRLNMAAQLAYGLYFRNFEMKKIGGGVLLNNFIQAATALVLGHPVTQRLRVFSAHDFNLGALMEVTGVDKERAIAEYGAIFGLELYRSRSKGNFSVLPIYVKKPGDKTSVLQFKGYSSNYCNLETFKQFTRQYLLPENDFYTLCQIKTEL